MEPLTEDYGSTGPREPQGMPWWPIAVVAALVIAVVAWYLWSRSRAELEPLPEVAEAPAAAPDPLPVEVEEPAEAWELPSLSESDDFLRDVAAKLSSHPGWVAWMATDDLIQRFVAAVDEVARGELPSTHLAHLGPKRGFSTATRGESAFLGSESFRRFGPLAAVVSGLDAEGSVDLYRRLRPLMQQAYRDLGYPNADFDRTLARAVEMLLSAPEQDRPPLLVRGVRTYEFADPELENLPEAQKLMLRMGPENARLVKAKLREFVAELDRDERTSEPSDEQGG